MNKQMNQTLERNVSNSMVLMITAKDISFEVMAICGRCTNEYVKEENVTNGYK